MVRRVPLIKYNTMGQKAGAEATYRWTVCIMASFQQLRCKWQKNTAQPIQMTLKRVLSRQPSEKTTPLLWQEDEPELASPSQPQPVVPALCDPGRTAENGSLMATKSGYYTEMAATGPWAIFRRVRIFSRRSASLSEGQGGPSSETK